MSRNHLVTLIALSLCNCSLYVDSDEESPGPRLADPNQLIGAWSSDDGLVIELSPTRYMLTSTDGAAASSMRVLRFETVFSRPHELVVSDEACGDLVGRYEWRIDDDVLRFDRIDDACEARQPLMTKALRAMEPTTQLPDRHALNRFDDNLWLQDSKTGPLSETSCDDCSEEISLAAARRGERWMTIESVTVLDEGETILAQCEVVFDLRAAHLRLADPIERLAVRRVAVESDCSHQVGTVGYMAIEKTESGFSMWPLSAGFVRPLDEDVITEYLPLER